jgi:hypothetical protein
MKMNISNFFKTVFFCITLTFIDDYTLNIDDIKKFEVLAFAGLCWPSLALYDFFKQKLAFFGKN